MANCLAASLLFSLRKFRNAAEPLRAVATVSVVRNAQMPFDDAVNRVVEALV